MTISVFYIQLMGFCGGDENMLTKELSLHQEETAVSLNQAPNLLVCATSLCAHPGNREINVKGIWSKYLPSFYPEDQHLCDCK